MSDDPWFMEDMPREGLWIRNIGGKCPCQAEGSIEGRPFYFRARHGTWTLKIARHECDPVCAGWKDQPPALYEANGEDPTGGWMEPEACAALLCEHHFAFRVKLLQAAPKSE